MRLQQHPDTDLETQLASWNPVARQSALATLENYDDSLAALKIARALLARRRAVDRVLPYSLVSMFALAAMIMAIRLTSSLTVLVVFPFAIVLCTLFGIVSRYSLRLDKLAERLPKEPSAVLTKPLIDLMIVETKPQEGDTSMADWKKVSDATCGLVARIDEETARSLTPTQFAWIRKEVCSATGLEDSPKSVAFLVGALLALAEGDGSSIADAVHLARTHVSEQVRAAAAECARRRGSQDNLSFATGQEATSNAAKQKG